MELARFNFLMPVKEKRIAILILFLSLLVKTGIHAQLLSDTSTFKLMCKGIDCIYNLQFTEAKDIYHKINIAYPAHPMTYVYKGLITYWENYPLIPTSPARKSFEKDMRYAIELCEKERHSKYEAEYLVSNLGGRGMLLLFYADNELSMEVISLATGTYQYIKESFNYTGSYADFYLFTGLYNYYQEVYPEAHPVYKPFTILFPKGDREKGLKELQMAAKNAIVLKAEAYSFLSGIYISFEKNFQQASQYSKALHELYPRNLQYMAVYIKNLLLTKRYAEAENMIISGSAKSNNAYFQAQLSILNGILYEKKYKNMKQARALYTKGITDIAPFGVFGNEFSAYGYFGLSRISEANGDKRYKRIYRNKAMDMASFKEVNFDN